MTSDPDRVTIWRLLPPSVRRFPADLSAVVGVTVLTLVVVLTPGLNGTPLRLVVALPFLVFLPGYALVALLFPASNDVPESAADGARHRSIDGIERVFLSVGASVALTTLAGYALDFTTWGIRLLPILASVSGVTVIVTGLAAYRRRQLPEDQRFRVQFDEWVERGAGVLGGSNTRRDVAVNAVLAFSCLFVVASVAYAVAMPQPATPSTNFFLVTENETGELTAGDYPKNFTVGERKSLRVGIENHENQLTNYTAVVLLQRVERVGNSTRVRRTTELDRTRVTVAAGETQVLYQPVTPTMKGDDLRLTFLLYKGSPPGEPTTGNAYRDLRLWINVSGSNAAAAVPGLSGTNHQDLAETRSQSRWAEKAGASDTSASIRMASDAASSARVTSNTASSAWRA